MCFFKCARSVRMLNLRWVGHQSHDPLVARLPNGDPKLYHLSQSRTAHGFFPPNVGAVFVHKIWLETFARILPELDEENRELRKSVPEKFQDTKSPGIFMEFSINSQQQILKLFEHLPALSSGICHKIPFSTVSLGQMLGCSGTSRVVPILTSLRRERPCGRKIGIEPFCDKMLTSEDSRFMVLYILLCYCSNSVAIQRILIDSAHFSDNLVSPCSGLNCFLAWWFFELVSPYRISDSRLEQACRSITRGRSQGFLSEKRSLLVVSCCRSWNCFSHISVPGSSWNYFAMIVMLQS